MNRCILMLSILSLTLTAAAEERIVGGTPAPAGAYPFFSTVTKQDGTHICGAALIAPQWVLTAAHCIRNQLPHRVQIGMEQYRPTVISLDTVEIAEAYIPADFKGWQPYSSEANGERSSGQYDIALLKLARSARSDHFLKLESQQANKEQPGDDVVLAGFGLTETGQQPDHLYHAEGKILETQRCIDVPEGYPDTNYDPALNVCADNMARGGDSGGPLLYRQNGEYVGLGLVSRGLIDAGQYTRISFFQVWMNVIMKEGKCDKFESRSNGLPICAAISAQPK
ncbi:peptidase S1 [Pseudomonas syringae]|uniref:Peptidase S1 n=1 Tax=Pseudomonas syringae TaxID=317 RepID=A0A1C7ZAF8_PSESX|nr:serine protease [Pseudomonas syringae]OCR27052.1 peptidase S1 [Pseudomonas syringae]